MTTDSPAAESSGDASRWGFLARKRAPAAPPAISPDGPGRSRIHAHAVRAARGTRGITAPPS